MANSVLMEIITPKEMFYTGQVEMLVVSTYDGEEGFMSKHTWCNKLLAEKGTVKIRETGSKDFKVASIQGGYVDIKDHFVVYTDDAQWV